MRDVMTIGVILSLAFVVPLFLNFFRATSGRPDSAEVETESANAHVFDSTDDWPSIIGMGDSDSDTEDPFEAHVQERTR
jgi:hypothetical protein